MNNKYGLVGVIMTVLIGIILVGSVLAPTINDLQKTAGDEITLNNTVRGTYTYNIWDGEDVTIEYKKSSIASTYTVNGDTLTLNIQQNILLASNFFSMRTGGSDASNPGINYQYQGLTAGAEATLTFEVSDGTYTLTIGGTVLTGDLEWMVYAVADGETGTSGLGQLTTPSSAFYTSDAQNIVVLGNIYTSGENDTYYAYYDGDLTVNEAYEDSSSVTVSQTDIDDYTNIYTTSVTVKIDTEEFTPYFILAPITVTGNEADGAEYNLYGVILVIFVVGIAVVGIRGFLLRDRD